MEASFCRLVGMKGNEGEIGREMERAAIINGAPLVPLY